LRCFFSWSVEASVCGLWHGGRCIIRLIRIKTEKQEPDPDLFAFALRMYLSKIFLMFEKMCHRHYICRKKHNIHITNTDKMMNGSLIQKKSRHSHKEHDRALMAWFFNMKQKPDITDNIIFSCINIIFCIFMLFIKR
jgi:hypothetical protein